MTGPIFDTHAHYSARAFDADRFALLDSLPGKGVVGVCEQATHSGDAPRVLELAHRYPWVVAAIGIHPESLLPAADCGEDGPAPTVSVYGGDWAAEMQALTPYYDDPKVVAVGECGLDYHWPVPKDAQLALFEAEIRLALELDKPIIVHDRQAHADVYALLKKYRPKGIVHCYSGSAEDAVQLAEILEFVAADEAQLRQNRVIAGGGMSLAEHEPVTIRPAGVFGVDAHVVVEYAGHQLHGGQRAAGMTAAGVGGHVDDVPAHLAAHAGQFCFIHGKPPFHVLLT